MYRKWLPIISFVLLVMVPPAAHAQSWSGIIDPSRAVDWSNAGVSGGIPSRTTICATLNPGVTAAQITSAIASCPSGQVVFLNAGTYNLSAGIDFANHSNVTLRGAGANQTFLVFSGGGTACAGPQADICIQSGDVNWPGGPSNTANWTTGYAKGTTQITLSSTANITPGRTFLVLDQCNDGRSGASCAGTETDPGTIFVCETIGICSPTDGPAGSERFGRAQEQLVKVTAVSGNTVTITPGLYMPNWRGSQSPGAWWGNTVITMDGVENLSADHTSSSASSGMMFFNAFDCWVKGVKDINSDRNHVWLQVTAHTTVRDSYFYGTKNAASQSYGVEPYMSSDNLIENNIFQHVAAAMMVNGAASGTVFGHNFAVDDYYFTPGWMMGSNWLHAAGIDSVLEEGNEGAGFISDDIHGTHHFVTLFRNQFIGWETTKTVQTTAVHLYTHSRYFNVVGNVLGKPGYHSQYQDSTPGGVLSAQSIYTLGWAGNDGTNLSAVLSDPFVIGSLMRWGNYDSVNAAAQWNSSEVPSGLTQFANPVPVNHNLPSSFYLSSKPSWWGSMPWPAVGPDVAGSPDPTGHAYVNPAQACYNSTAKDGSGLLQFNAGACYGSSSAIAPAAPTGLRATVQ